MLATLVGAVVGLDECTKVDNIDDSDTLNRDMEEKVTLAKVVNSTDCKWTEIQCTDAVIHWLEGGKREHHNSPPRRHLRGGLQKSEERGQQVSLGEQTVIPRCGSQHTVHKLKAVLHTNFTSE